MAASEGASGEDEGSKGVREDKVNRDNAQGGFYPDSSC